MSTTKKPTSRQWDSVEYNNKNSYYKIGYYVEEKNEFVEVARWRNAYSKTGANYGLLQIWTSSSLDFCCFSSQGSNNTCGGYNKPIANLENILRQYKIEHDDFNYSNCGSIESLLTELKDYLQSFICKKLFSICCE